MYDETRRAVRRALDVGKILFGLGPERFEKLVKITNKIPSPTAEQIQSMKEAGLSFEEATRAWCSQSYADAAVSGGFTKEQGLAILAYAALIKDLDS